MICVYIYIYICYYAATYLQLPLLNPYLNMGANMTRGVNYAVSGATAIDAMKLLTTYNILSLPPLSLHIQLLWHSTLKATVDSLASVGLTFPGNHWHLHLHLHLVSLSSHYAHKFAIM